LGRLAAVTIDEVGTETFVTSGALERLRKSVQLERLSVYHDSDSLPWKPDKSWVDMSPQEWSEIFEEGIAQDAFKNMVPSKWATGRQYLLHPVGGLLTHFRRGKREKRSTHVPFQEASLLLEAVTVTVSEVLLVLLLCMVYLVHCYALLGQFTL
jgi:vacuolar protein sorting-associated protein 13A/C